MVEPAVCAIPVVLCTLTILFVGNTFNTLTTSAVPASPDPIRIEPPTDIVLGIAVRRISWTNPLALPTVISADKLVKSVLTPTLNESVRFVILVLNPDIWTASWLFNSMNG